MSFRNISGEHLSDFGLFLTTSCMILWILKLILYAKLYKQIYYMYMLNRRVAVCISYIEASATYRWLDILDLKFESYTQSYAIS